MKNVHVMVDLETLGTRAGCAVLSIGAAAGLVEDPATVAWWDGQSNEAKETLRAATSGASALSLGHALAGFDHWLGGLIEAGGDLRVWGNGADFDLPILGAAYVACGFDAPWKPYAGRCCRTLKNLRPDIKLVRAGTHHNARDDARDQAEHCARLLTEFGGW